MKNYVGLRKDKLLYLPGFQSAKRFGQDHVEYPDYYSNRRMKAKWKGLPPVIHRQQAPLTAGTIALIIIIYPLGDTSVQRGRLSTSVLLLQPLCKFLLIDLAVLAPLLFLLRILAPRGERLLRDLSRANPREAAFILAAIDLLVVSMGYTPDGRRRNPQQKTVKPPAEQKMQYARDASLDSCVMEQVML